MMPGVKNLAKHWMNRSVSFFGWFLRGVELFIGVCWDFLCSMNGWRELLLCSTAWECGFFRLFFEVSEEAFSRQCMARDMWCSAAIFLRFKMAYLMRPNEVLMLTPVVSAISLKLMSW